MTAQDTLGQLLARIERLEARAAWAEAQAAELAARVRLHEETRQRDVSGALSRQSSRRGFLKLAGLGAAGATAAGALALDAARPARAEAGTSTLPVYNVQGYGATGNGTTDDTAAINAAIADAANAGGGIVFVPAGTYRVSPSPHPQNAAYGACVLMRGGVILRGAGMGASTIRLSDNAALPSGSAGVYLLLNGAINPAISPAGRDEGMVVEDITVDGNTGKQTALTHGISWIACRDVHHSRVRVTDVYGTGNSGGAAETFAFEFQLGADAFYSCCEAVATGVGSTSTGFSADDATGVTYVSCLAHDLKVGNGFTHHGCAVLRYAGCHSHGNGSYGFNSEMSEDVRYDGCVAGGRADPTGGGAFAPLQSLGNAGAGIAVSGSTAVDLTGCSSRYNGSHGLWIANGADGIRVSGGEYAHNGGWGIEAQGGSNLFVSPETRLAANAAGGAQVTPDTNAASPFLYDSGWVAAAAATLALTHGLPGRPRYVAAYAGGPTAPSDATFVQTYTGPVATNNAQITVAGLTPGAYYRVVAMF